MSQQDRSVILLPAASKSNIFSGTRHCWRFNEVRDLRGLTIEGQCEVQSKAHAHLSRKQIQGIQFWFQKRKPCPPLRLKDSLMVIMWVQGMTFKEWTRSRSQQDTMVDFFKCFKKTCDPFGGSSFGDIAPSKRESHSWGNMHLLYGIQDSEHRGPKRWTILETRDPRTIETS